MPPSGSKSTLHINQCKKFILFKTFLIFVLTVSGPTNPKHLGEIKNAYQTKNVGLRRLNSLCLFSWFPVLYFFCSVLLFIWFCSFELCKSVFWVLIFSLLFPVCVPVSCKPALRLLYQPCPQCLSPQSSKLACISTSSHPITSQCFLV